MQAHPRAARKGHDTPATEGLGGTRPGSGPQSQVLPLAHREAGLVWQAGLRAFEWIDADPAGIPFPRFAQWVLRLAAEADAGLSRLPLRGQRRNSTGFPFSLNLRSRDHLTVGAR